MIRELSYQFEDLKPDYNALALELGYPLDELPEPFGQYMEEALQFAAGLNDIGAVFQIFEPLEFAESKRAIRVNGLELKPGKTIVNELRGAERLACFICTGGKRISEEAERMMRFDDMVYGYVLNVLGTVVLRQLETESRSRLLWRLKLPGMKITNRYSPGYCHWNVAEQHRLFSLFGDKTAGVTLTASALMYPVKSISGLIGIGRNVEFRHYQCDLCNLPNCVYRGK